MDYALLSVSSSFTVGVTEESGIRFKLTVCPILSMGQFSPANVLGFEQSVHTSSANTSSFELSTYFVSVNECDSELSVSPISVSKSNVEPSVCSISSNMSDELSVCPVLANGSDVEPSVCPVLIQEPVICPINQVMNKKI